MERSPLCLSFRRDIANYSIKTVLILYILITKSIHVEHVKTLPDKLISALKGFLAIHFFKFLTSPASSHTIQD